MFPTPPMLIEEIFVFIVQLGKKNGAKTYQIYEYHMPDQKAKFC